MTEVLERIVAKEAIYFRGVEIVYNKDRQSYLFACFMFSVLALMFLYNGLSNF